MCLSNLVVKVRTHTCDVFTHEYRWFSVPTYTSIVNVITGIGLFLSLQVALSLLIYLTLTYYHYIITMSLFLLVWCKLLYLLECVFYNFLLSVFLLYNILK